MVPQMKNSPASLKIVMAFLQFLNIVQINSPEEQECLQTIKVCLKTLFRIQDSHEEDAPTGSVTDILNFGEMIRDEMETEPDFAGASSSAPDIPSPSSSAPDVPFPSPSASDPESYAWSESYSGTDLYGLFNLMLPRTGFLNLNKYTALHMSVFLDAVEEMTAPRKQFNLFNLAEAFHILGHKAIRRMDYHGAACLYTYAIAMWEHNAAFYLNRAYALVHMKFYQQAMSDCMRASLINPRHKDTFNAIGLIYYNQGNYVDAICKGFSKALEIDPLNGIVRQNMELSAQNLKAKQDKYEQEIFDLQVLISIMVEEMEHGGGRGRRQQNRGRGQRRRQNARRTGVSTNNYAVQQGAHEVIDVMPEDYEQPILSDGGGAAPVNNDGAAAPVNNGGAAAPVNMDAPAPVNNDEGYAAF